MPKTIPERLRIDLIARLEAHRDARWPELGELSMRFRGAFAYVEGDIDGCRMPLFRLKSLGSRDVWMFAMYLGSRDGYEPSLLPNGRPFGPPELAMDCACGLYLGDPTAWLGSFDAGSD